MARGVVRKVHEMRRLGKHYTIGTLIDESSEIIQGAMLTGTVMTTVRVSVLVASGRFCRLCSTFAK